MGRRSTTSPYGSNDMLVDNRIGSAFPIVCAVERRLPEIIYLSQQTDNIHKWHDETQQTGKLVNDLAEDVANAVIVVNQQADNVAQGAQYVADTLPAIIGNADRAVAAEERAELISQRINETTTMDFINFEINTSGELLVHFAGYADESNFSINDQGQLEVTL